MVYASQLRFWRYGMNTVLKSELRVAVSNINCSDFGHSLYLLFQCTQWSTNNCSNSDQISTNLCHLCKIKNNYDKFTANYFQCLAFLVPQEEPATLQMPDELFATSSANLVDRPPTYQRAVRCTFVLENETTATTRTTTAATTRTTTAATTKIKSRRRDPPPSYIEAAAKTSKKLHLFKISQNFKPNLTPTRV